jgi:hypothetical protein
MPDVEVTAASRLPAAAFRGPADLAQLLAIQANRSPGARMGPQSATTDEAGNYVLTGLAPGDYTVTTKRAGVANASKHVKLNSGEELTVDLAIPADPAIRGRVLHQNKEPAVDAFVWLLKPEYQSGVLRQTIVGPKITEEDGSFAFDTGLEVNRKYTLLVDVSPPEEVVAAPTPDFKDRQLIEAPTYYPSATRMESAAPVILQPGERRERVEIEIATAGFYCVDGKIQVSGSPSSASFAIRDRSLAGSRLVRLRGYSGEDGKFHVCGLSPGLYRLSTDGGAADFAVSDSDLQHVDISVDTASLRLRVDWDGDPPPLPDPDLDATAYTMLRKVAAALGLSEASSDADLKQLAIRLSQAHNIPDPSALAHSDQDTGAALGYLAGRLTPRADTVMVTLSDTAEGFTRSTAAPIPSESPFETGIPAGDYTVDVGAFGPRDSYVKEVAFSGLKVADGLLRIAPGASGALHLLVARGTASLTVHVTDGEGKPVPDATVVLIPDSVTSVPALSRLLIRGQTDQNGMFTSPPLTPGKYRVLASAQSPRWDAPEDLEEVLLLMFQAGEVELGSKSTQTITLQPIPIF